MKPRPTSAPCYRCGKVSPRWPVYVDVPGKADVQKRLVCLSCRKKLRKKLDPQLSFYLGERK